MWQKLAPYGRILYGRILTACALVVTSLDVATYLIHHILGLLCDGWFLLPHCGAVLNLGHGFLNLLQH